MNGRFLIFTTGEPQSASGKSVPLKSRIDRRFVLHDRSRVTQGDILRDLSHAVVEVDGNVYAMDLPYSVVITQDCDLKQGADTLVDLPQQETEWGQFVPNLILLPCFPAEALREGQHLREAFKVSQPRINSDRWKIVRQNRNPRYHFIAGHQSMQIPDLAIDFKLNMTVPSRVVSETYENTYLATLNELFREDLSQRFCGYLSRIGLPVLDGTA